MIDIWERVFRLPEESFKIYRYIGDITYKDSVLTTAGQFFAALREQTYKNKDGIQYEQSE